MATETSPLIPSSVPANQWDQIAIAHIKTFEDKTVNRIAKNCLQQRLDEAGQNFEETMSSLPGRVLNGIQHQFETAIDKLATFSENLAVALRKSPKTYQCAKHLADLVKFLVALPFKAACNIAKSIYQMIKAAAYTVVHPLKAMTGIAKMLIKITKELTKVETWQKMGAGMVGAGLAQLVYANPAASLGIMLGSIILIGTLFFDDQLDETMRRGNFAQIKAFLIDKCSMVSEALMTGFLMGLLVGGIHKATTKPRIITEREAQTVGEKFLEEQRAIHNKSSGWRKELTLMKAKASEEAVEIEMFSYIRSINKGSSSFHTVRVTDHGLNLARVTTSSVAAGAVATNPSQTSEDPAYAPLAMV